MSEGNAAGRKTDEERRVVSNCMTEMIKALSASTHKALETADEEAKVEGYRYDSRGRFRDHEVEVAVRLSNSCARLADMLVKIATINDKQGWKPREL